VGSNRGANRREAAAGRPDAPARQILPRQAKRDLRTTPAWTTFLPSVSALWSFVFGNDRPVEIEIGPGRGDVLMTFAAARPEVNFFAIEHVRGAVEYVQARVAHAGFENVRVLAADARCVVTRIVPPASVAAYHVYFPDPWPKRRHRKRRLVDVALAAALRRTLVPGGAVHVATDLRDLFEDIRAALVAGGLQPSPTQAAPARPVTRFERKYAAAGTHAGSFVAG